MLNIRNDFEPEIELEREGDAPEGWVSNAIFVLDGRGNMAELEIPDDIAEVSEDA